MLRSANELCDLRSAMARVAAEIDTLFDAILGDGATAGSPLTQAMRHAAIGGGKCLRPLLVVSAGALFGVPRQLALRAGAAVEALHVHSLIHDDLPCMDDDDLRRGKPTVHRAFDEATAVLAGDALHALAFEVLGDIATHPDSAVRAELVVSLARAAGMNGMAQGQMLDLGGNSRVLAEVIRLQSLKTGALICWCLEAGAVMGYASPEARETLRQYGQCLGLAFQIADDLLDIEGDSGAMGKAAGKDVAQGKATIVGLLGVAGARDRAALLVEQALGHLDQFGEDAALLRDVAQFAIVRDR
jgi:farnesyl diphosphate synthase